MNHTAGRSKLTEPTKACLMQHTMYPDDALTTEILATGNGLVMQQCTMPVGEAEQWAFGASRH